MGGDMIYFHSLINGNNLSTVHSLAPSYEGAMCTLLIAAASVCGDGAVK
jgi:hypothetical protein